MRSSHHPQSTTSLPRAPRDEASTRFIKYSITMSIRVICFILMVVITPYSWYTWLFAIGAVFLPYFAVVIANVGLDRAPTAISPERALDAHAPGAPTAAPSARETVIRISETPGIRPTDAEPWRDTDATDADAAPAPDRDAAPDSVDDADGDAPERAAS